MVVGGMKLAPIDPTFTEQRDALLAALATLAPADVGLVAAAFSKRGAGACAVSPARASQDLTGVVESFENKSRPVLGATALVDDVTSCDGDGHLDAAEVGHLTVALTNTGSGPMTGAKLTVATGAVGVAFPGGTTASFPTIAPYATAKATLLVSLDKAAPQRAFAPFDLTITTPDGCTTELAAKPTLLTNYDEVAATATVDSFETDLDVWTRDGKHAADVWTHEAPTPDDRVWHAIDYPTNSDTRLVSPSLVVGAADDLVLTFEHRYKFETGPDGQNGPIVNWDGGLIEVTTDGGATWVDAATLAAAGYTGTIGDAGNKAHNPLNGRKGFVGQSASWPATDKVTVSFGKQLAGKTIRVRFRAGSDDASSDFGWEIDDVAFTGLVGKPFPALADDQGVCNAPPVAVVGPDQVVPSGAHVALDAQGSSDPDGDALSFAWAQSVGPAVALTGAGSASASFDAPLVAVDTALTFVVGVSDGKATSSAKANVLVTAVIVPPDAGAGGQAAADAGAGGAGGVAAGGFGGAGLGGGGGAGTGGAATGGWGGAGGAGTGGAGTGGTGIGGAGSGGGAGHGLGGSGPLGGGGLGGAGVGGSSSTTTTKTGTGTGGSGTVFDTGVESRDPLQPSDSGGCGCEAAGASSGAGGWLALLAPLAAVFARRRRRS
jgi:MYXO-CTERM domain-containing protein